MSIPPLPQEGYRQVLGVVEGAKEDAESWRQFLRHLKQRGLSGVRLVTSDKCLGLVEALGELYPEADWQRCMVHCLSLLHNTGWGNR